MQSACAPLVGESAFFDGSFYAGFWSRDVPPLIPMGGETSQMGGGGGLPSGGAGSAGANSFKTPEACRYGPKCRFKLSCSRFHGEG